MKKNRYLTNVNAVVEAARANKRVVISNQEEFLAVSHRLTQKVGKMFSVMSLNFNGATGRFSPMAVKVPVSLETAELEKYVRPENVHINSITMMPVERFCRAYINVCSADKPELLDLLLIDKHIYCIVETGTNGKAVSEGFYVMSNTEGYLMDITADPENKKTALLYSIEDFQKENVRVYEYSLLGVSSPGQQKQGEITLYCENLDGFDAKEHLDKMTHGMFRLLCQYYAGREGVLKTLAQISTRISQFKAGMVRTKPIQGIAISMFKVEDSLGNEWMDGLQLFSAESVAHAFSDEQFTVLPSAVDGAAAQARPLIVNKGLGLCMPTQCVLTILRALGCKFVFLAQDELTDEQFKNYQKAVLEKNTEEEPQKAGPYSGKTVVVLPTFKKEDGSIMTDEEKLEHIDAWVDLNVHKTVCDIRRPFTGFNVMGFDHGKKSIEEEANTSNQLLASAVFADTLRTRAYMQECAQKEADGIMANAVRMEGRQLKAKDLLGDLAMAAQNAFPQFAVKHWAPYFQDTLNKALEGYSTRLKKLSVGTDGIYLKIIPDLSNFFGISLLQYDAEAGTCEVLAPQLSKANIRRAIAIKYPKMAVDEFAKIIPVAPEDLVERARYHLEQGSITEEQFDVLQHVFYMLHDGIIMVPAIEELKNMLAGMDFDGDALVAYCDETLVDIIWAINPVATTIMENKKFAKFQAPIVKERLKKTSSPKA